MCPLSYGFRLVVLAEFGQCREQICEGFVADLNVDDDNKALFWAFLVGLFVLFRCGALFFLKQKAGKFY